MRYEVYKLQYPDNCTVSEYNKYCNEEAAKRKIVEEERAKTLDEELVARWCLELKRTEPHESLVAMFQSSKAIDDFMQQDKLFETTASVQKTARILSKTLEELKRYEDACLKRAEARKDGGPRIYNMFTKLYSIRKGNTRNPEFDIDQCKDINELVCSTGDEHGKYFTRIEGLRSF